MGIRHKLSVPADHFTIIRNDWLRDERLSWKARGLVAYLASHRVGWETSLEQLARAGKDGKDAIRAGLRELEDAGYLKIDRQRNEDGTLAGTDYVLTDPWDMPTSGNPKQDSPKQAEPTPKKTSSSEDQSENTNGSRKRSTSRPPNWGPNSVHREQASADGLDLNREVESFKAWTDAKGAKFANWDAAFRNHLIRAGGYAKQRNGDDRGAMLARLAAEAEQETLL